MAVNNDNSKNDNMVAIIKKLDQLYAYSPVSISLIWRKVTSWLCIVLKLTTKPMLTFWVVKLNWLSYASDVGCDMLATRP